MKIIESPTIRLTQPILGLLLGVFSLLISSSVGFIQHTPTYVKRTTVTTTTTNFVPTKLFHNKGHDFFDDTWGWSNNNPPSNDGNSNNDKNGNPNEGGNGKDVFDMEELKTRISSLKQSKSVAARPSSGLASSVKTSIDTSPPAKKPDEVHIILFNPDTEQEGVHTIEFPKGSGNNVILAFENAEACDMFSKMLKDQLFMDPIPQKMKLEFLEDYCTTLGVSVQLIPNGMNIRPPKDNAESLANPEWKENIATLESIYSIPSTPSFQDGGNTNIKSSGTGTGTESGTESGNNVHPKNDQKVNVMVGQEENDNIIMADDDLMANVKFVLSDLNSWGVWE